jgi:uncharacterized protein (DUF58 family)
VPLLPSRRLAAFIALAAAAFLIGTGTALAIDAVLMLAITAEAILLFRQPLPLLERSAPQRIALGGSAEVAWELHNTADMPRRVAWTDDAGPGIERVGEAVLEATIPPRGRLSRATTFLGSERGTTTLGDAHVRVLGPLGLLWRRFRVPLRDGIMVQPGLRELHRHRLLAMHQRTGAGARRVRQVGEGREFERLTEYVRGDDPRRIDWKATARRGGLIVRQYEAERSQSIVLAIDAGRLMMERFADRERLDHALAAALVLADTASLRGDATGVLLFADRVQAFLPPARNPLSRIADTLAAVDARRVEPDYPAAFRYLGRQLRRRSLVVLFTDVIDTRSSAALLEQLSISARRHLPLIVAMRNVELEAAALATVGTEEDAFHRAAAEELMQARAIALAGIRRQGVLVADVRPEAAIAEALSRYLEVKRRGLL